MSQDKYVELEVLNWGVTLEELEDFCRRARNCGHNSFDTIVRMGYYDDVSGVTLRSEFSEAVETRKTMDQIK